MSGGGQHRNALPAGYRLEHYRLESVLGHGGFGITYRALDEDLQQVVAIKEYLPREVAARDRDATVVPLSEADTETFTWGLERFLDEARTLARFRHPNIVGVRRFLRANGTAYLVMDYCAGESLEGVLAREGTLSAARVGGLLVPLLNALEALHAAGVTHRDVKPGNIFLRADGSPVLLDFGAARQALAQHSRSVTALATPGYAAFEQYSTKGRQGPWTDIYGLGATLYRCVSGQRPPDAGDRMFGEKLVPAVEAGSGRYPRPLLEQIDSALQLRPEDRPQSINEWRRLAQLESASRSRATALPLVEERDDRPKPRTAKDRADRDSSPEPRVVAEAIAAVAKLITGVQSALVPRQEGSQDQSPARTGSKPVLEGLLSFSGRRNRKSYLLALIVLLGCLFGLVLVFGVILEIGMQSDEGWSFIGLLSLVVLLSGGVVTAQRVRDLGYSGWWAILVLVVILIPYVGWLILLPLVLVPGNTGPNVYGPDPLEALDGDGERSAGAPSLDGLIDGRYQILGAQGEIVRDIVTGLEWQRCSLGQTWDGRTCSGEARTYTWDEAREAADRVAGWRLPTIEELRTLVHCSSGYPARFSNGQRCKGEYRRPTIVQAAFPDTPSSFFWSGSPYASGSNLAWYVDFLNGYAVSGNRSGYNRVRLVRGGQ